MNGYFQLMITEQVTAIRLVPPTMGGEPISIGELLEYLRTMKIEGFDVKKLNSKIAVLKEEQVVPLVAKSMYPVNETFVLKISQDNMEAVVRFYPPSTNGSMLSKEEIISDLNLRKVSYGIDEKVIDEFLEHRSYCQDIVVAKGKAPIQGVDGRIEYMFNTEINTRPKRNEDGSVDFFHLNTINHCKEGELLARMIPPVLGEAGMDVLGEKISPREVKRENLSFGRNITISDDKTELYSQINGHVSLVTDKVFVSDVFEVENVGPATGNITSQGSVQVNGNVKSGYVIEAKDNVHVHGVVEGATIIAGGNIIIDRGMNGMGKGVLQAGGSVVVKFLENATVTSGEYVEADCILHSKVMAKTEINVDGKKGFIAGGSVRATNKVSCRTLGSAMGADTYVEVGIDPEMKEQIQKLQIEIVEIQKNLKSMQPILESATKKIKSGVKISPEQMKYIQSMAVSTKEQQERLVEAQAEFASLETLLENKGNACICVRDDAYAGTKVSISGASLVLKDRVQFCRLVYDRGDVRVAAF